MSNTSKLAYAIAFQVGWFICITAGNFISVFYTVIFLAFHIWFSKKSFYYPSTKDFFYKEIAWILIILCFGIIIETLSFSGGFLYLQTSHALQASKNLPTVQKPFEQFLLPPIWLMCLWIMFALALRTCLSFLFQKPITTYLLSIALVPLNYYAGASLSTSIDINQPFFLSLAFITILWLVFLCSMMQIKHHYFEELFHAK